MRGDAARGDQVSIDGVVEETVDSTGTVPAVSQAVGSAAVDAELDRADTAAVTAGDVPAGEADQADRDAAPAAEGSQEPAAEGVEGSEDTAAGNRAPAVDGSEDRSEEDRTGEARAEETRAEEAGSGEDRAGDNDAEDNGARTGGAQAAGEVAPAGRGDGDAGPQRDDRREEGGEFTRSRAPELPEDADIAILDPEVKQELRGLPKGLAEIVGRHLAAAGILIDSEPELALEHARYARGKAARVGVVREAAGLAAYHAGEWGEALSELRAARRMTHGAGHVAVMADCERALGRPERAIELAREAQGAQLSPEEAVELRIVAAGARRDMGQLDAAVVALQGADLDAKRRDPWSARLFYAYADNLAAAGRTEEAVQWFLNAAQADDDNETDAAERAFDLSPQEG